MPTLEELRTRWFLDYSAPVSTFPPIERHAGSGVSNYTDGNRVKMLLDGQDYMETWYELVVSIIGQPDSEIYHSAWRLENVHTLGHSQENSDALQALIDAENGGVTVVPVACPNILMQRFNAPSLYRLNENGVVNAAFDFRFPSAGSNHQKFTCFKSPAHASAMLGSIDIAKSRWDTRDHASDVGERNPDHGKPTHDMGVLIEGPAVTDIELSFRERWNDRSRAFGLKPLAPHPIVSSVTSSAPIGTHSIQVLHTFGITSESFGYTWSPVGEFSIWAAYLKAIISANQYIYIEDQYFFSFGWRPGYMRSGIHQESDIIFQLGESIKRGVKVVVVVPMKSEDLVGPYQKHQRDLGVTYLANIAATSSGPGDFVIGSLHNGTNPIFVHSKLMICDDEFILIGSANICQRSMTHDGELHIGVVDTDNILVLEFRKQLWAEHLQSTILDNPIDAYNILKAQVAGSGGRLRSYPVKPVNPEDPADSAPLNHWEYMPKYVDPYAGPPRT